MHTALKLIHERHLQAEPGTDGAGAPAAMVASVAGSTPLVLDSPHSGTFYPADFRSCCDMAILRTAEDTHVEKLYAFAPAMGVAWVEALFPRSYLDANRDTLELDTGLLDAPWPDPVATDPKVLSKVRLGKGLIWKFTDDGRPIYDRALSVDEVRGRIDRCWKPYYAAVGAAIEAAHRRHGFSVHINCHSMPAIAGSHATDFPGLAHADFVIGDRDGTTADPRSRNRHATDFPGLAHADFVIGDRDGTTADPRLSKRICEFLRARGYSVDYNHPYKGVELVRRFGRPAEGRHSIQVEINRKLYMDEASFAVLQPGFDSLQADLRGLVESLVGFDGRL